MQPLAAFFHRWEQRLAAGTRTARVVRPFEWGLDWLPDNGAPHNGNALAAVRAWVDSVMDDTEAFFTPEPTTRYTFEAGTLTFPSAFVSPHAENNLVRARLFPARDRRRAVVVMPQWNADADGHIGLSRLLARLGITALRLSKPYHDVRMPPELTRADYIVSANVVRTVPVDADRRARTAGPDAGTQPRVAVFRRRGVAGHRHIACPGRARRPRRSRHAARSLAPDQPVVVPRACERHEDAARVCEVRSSFAGETFRRAWPCCRAATTALAKRRSSISTRTTWRASSAGTSSR
jgi:hypothetical protein